MLLDVAREHLAIFDVRLARAVRETSKEAGDSAHTYLPVVVFAVVVFAGCTAGVFGCRVREEHKRPRRLDNRSVG